MKYKVFVKQAIPSDTKEVNLNAAKIAEFNYGGTIAVEDILHLKSNHMINGFEPAPVKVVEIEHDLDSDTIYLGVSTDVETYAQGEDSNGETFVVTVPSIGQLVDMKAEEENDGRPEVVMLLGSSRYYDEILQIEKLLTLKGKVVLKHSPFDRNEHDDLTKKDFNAITTSAKAKLNMADVIYLVRPQYVGESTRKILEYVDSIGKRVEDISREGRLIREIAIHGIEHERIERSREGRSRGR